MSGNLDRKTWVAGVEGGGEDEKSEETLLGGWGSHTGAREIMAGKRGEDEWQ